MTVTSICNTNRMFFLISYFLLSCFSFLLIDEAYASAAAVSASAEAQYGQQENLIHFRYGDLVYGLNNEEALNRLRSGRYAFTAALAGSGQDYGAVTADRINNPMLSLLRDKKATSTINSPDKLNNYLNELSENGSILEIDIPRFKNYLLFLYNFANGTFSPASVLNDTSIQNEDAQESKILRNSCQAAMLYALHNGYKIHFVLDQINYQAVVTQFTTSTLSYTSEELIAIFYWWLVWKLYPDLQLPNILETVVFYNNNRLLQQPPWLDVSGSYVTDPWTQLIPDELRSRLTAPPQNFDDAMDEDALSHPASTAPTTPPSTPPRQTRPPLSFSVHKTNL
ncbi:MAG: hypothetical protein HQK53_05350 [Oligoflexia bacterium]|nr:hypothetical protein [Oligoflexia bacterium]